MYSYLTPEYRLLCPSGMNDWLRTARQSKNSHFDMVRNERKPDLHIGVPECV